MSIYESNKVQLIWNYYGKLSVSLSLSTTSLIGSRSLFAVLFLLPLFGPSGLDPVPPSSFSPRVGPGVTGGAPSLHQTEPSRGGTRTDWPVLE